MCQDCGCSTNKEHAKKEEFQVFKKVLEKNDLQAEENREHFERYGVFAINLMSSPGSGKTSLLEKTIELLQDIRIGVIEGDLETDRDAQRIRAKGGHLDAFMVHEGIHLLSMESLDLVCKKETYKGFCAFGW